MVFRTGIFQGIRARSIQLNAFGANKVKLSQKKALQLAASIRRQKPVSAPEAWSA
jgi:hypothetical protein